MTDKPQLFSLSEQQLNAVTQAIKGLNSSQLHWVSGYIAGLAAGQSSSAELLPPSASSADAPSGTVTILFGSQTGNTKQLATKLHTQVSSSGINAQLISMADYKARQLKTETHLVVLVSTHGEGDAPDDAVELHEFLGSKKAPKLAQLKYAVVGLGDTSYEFFCQTGKDFDARLSALGAQPILERADLDVDYEETAPAWFNALIEKLKAEFATSSVQNIDQATPAPTSTSVSYSKAAPFSADFLVAQKITGRDSVKDIRHIEISLEGSGMSYQPGDALGVWFHNDSEVVQRILSAVQLTGTEQVQVGGQATSILQALVERLEITLSYPGFVKAYAAATEQSALLTLLEDGAGLREYLASRQIVDIVSDFPAAVDAQRFVDAFRPITPRLYSIASSQAEVGDEVHLTVAHVDYHAHGFRHQGGASGYLCERIAEGQSVSVYVEPNDNFRLPPDPNTPIIMIGPGTGIAPFRAFMQERDANGAEGKNWLFFGNPNFTQDFLYQVEWQAYVKSGLLTRISLAFSRDQAEKIYVQHRLLENGADVYAWLEEGAHLYVCGDASRMAKDVEDALLKIIQLHGKKSEQDAKAYLLALRKARRYQKDVY